MPAGLPACQEQCITNRKNLGNMLLWKMLHRKIIAEESHGA